MKNIARNISRYDMDDVLHLMGLQRRSSFTGILLPAIGLVAVSAAVGAAVGLALAPSSGIALRQDLSSRFGMLRDRVKHEALRVKDEAARQMSRAEKPVLNAVQHGTGNPHS